MSPFYLQKLPFLSGAVFFKLFYFFLAGMSPQPMEVAWSSSWTQRLDKGYRILEIATN